MGKNKMDDTLHAIAYLVFPFLPFRIPPHEEGWLVSKRWYSFYVSRGVLIRSQLSLQFVAIWSGSSAGPPPSTAPQIPSMHVFSPLLQMNKPATLTPR